MATNSNVLSRALVAYLGYGIDRFPKEDMSRLISTFGEELSTKLRPQVQEILAELGQLKPNWEVHTLESSGAWAKQEMKKRHPNLDNDALDALGWTFTWWWR